jgi:WD40 repeat protein
MARWYPPLALVAIPMTFLLAARASANPEIAAKPPAGDIVATASGNLATASGIAIRVIDKKSGKLVWQVQTASKTDIQFLTFAPDGKTLAAGDKGGVLYMYDVSTGAYVWLSPPEKRPAAGVNLLRFSPDGKLLACADSDGIVSMRSASEGKLLWRAKDKIRSVYDLCFSADGKTVTAKESKTCVVGRAFEAATGEPTE